MSTSLRKGLQVLDFLAEAQGPATVREISRGTGLPKSTVHRLASELHELGVIEVEPSGSRLELRLFELGGVALRQTRLEEIVRPYMEELYGSREGVMAGPLDGVKVVEFSEGVSGPMTARLLGDAGADVIKLEGPHGDRARGWGPAEHEGTSVVFQALNRNKRSVVVDPEVSKGVLTSDVVQQLLAQAQVLVVDHGLLEVAAVMREHPRLIVCVVSGWGPNGPWADLFGGELPAQLASEATASLGRIGEEPVRLGTDHASMLTATFALQGIVAALLAFDEVGAQRVDVSLFGSLMQMRTTLWVALSNRDYWAGFHVDCYVKPPEYGYECKDRRVYFSLGRVPDMAALIVDLKMEWVFDDPRWEMLKDDVAGGAGPNSHLVHDLWDRGVSQWNAAEAEVIVERHGGWMFPYLDYREFVADAQSDVLELFPEVTDQSGVTTRQVRPPWELSDTPASIRLPAPLLGEHTHEFADARASEA
jgi:crotonobetainyl-CoA:carnitine CoA-transferase CaiB-like acyl-CoA transferase